jgi:hypothetical protein
MPAAKAWPSGRRITIHDIQAATDPGRAVFTSYDMLTAAYSSGPESGRCWSAAPVPKLY